MVRAEVPTKNGSRYLQQLCKHWSHRFEVTFDVTQGVVQLNGAVCRFTAEPERLVLLLEGKGLDRISGVVAEHLQRFAFREALVVEWAEASPSPVLHGRERF